jgi:ribosomal protein L22
MMHKQHTQACAKKSLTGVYQVRLALQNLYEVFCRTEGQEAKKNPELVPFVKYMVKLTKGIEDVLANSELINQDGVAACLKEKKSVKNLRKDVQALIK